MTKACDSLVPVASLEHLKKSPLNRFAWQLNLFLLFLEIDVDTRKKMRKKDFENENIPSPPRRLLVCRFIKLYEKKKRRGKVAARWNEMITKGCAWERKWIENMRKVIKL